MNRREDLMTGLFYSITRDELKRRHELLRDFMQGKDIGALLVILPDAEGYRRWLTGEDSAQRKTDCCFVVPEEGEIRQVMGNEEMCSLIEEELRNMPGLKNGKKLGLIHGDEIRAVWKEKIDACLPKVKLVEVTKEFNRIKAVKSVEEQRLAENAAALADKVMEGLYRYIRPELLERDVVCYARYLANRWGSGGIDSMLSAQVQLISWKKKQTAGPLLYPGRWIQRGDMLLIRLRILGDSGFYGTVCRCVSIGEPQEADRNMWNQVVGFQQRIAEALLPGNSVEQAVKSAKENRKKTGKEDRKAIDLRIGDGNHVHGIGYCVTEVPDLFDKSAKMPLKEGMILAVEPELRDQEGNIFCCGDMYRIQENRAVRLTKIGQDIKIVV